MVESKKNLAAALGKILVFAYFILFPFGQLLSTKLSFLGLSIPVHAIDILAILTIFPFLVGKLRLPRTYSLFLGFLMVATFSNILALKSYPSWEILIGLLYLLRFFSYSTLFLLAWNLVKQDKKLSDSFFDLLIISSIFTAVFGWIQYLFFPDLTSLRYVGWDDHLYRLVGTHLDPGFTGIILVFGFVASFNRFLRKKEGSTFWLSLLFLLSLAFTYSRASYLAFAFAVLTIAVRKGMKKSLFLVLTLLIMILFLPRPAGEGVRLERVASVLARAQNYGQTLTIIKKYPLFGVGFNNLCAERTRLFGGIGYASHACSGSDSSLLLVAATTGIVGLIIFFYMALKIVRGLRMNLFGETLLASGVALLVHSLFVNSLFYPWVMGFLAVLLAISLRE